jgi:5'-methylthioadenosine phosphorylase
LAVNRLLHQQAKKLKYRIFSKATVVVIQGPRFSSMAESQWYTQMGWDIINMTQYPEVILAKELSMGYSAVAVVTDYDAGLVAGGKVRPVSATEVIKRFNQSIPLAKKLILETIKHWPKKLKCDCHKSLEGARLS